MPLSGSRPLPGSLVDKTLSISSSTSPYHGDFRSHLPQLRELLYKMSNEHGIQLHHSSHMTAQLLKWNYEFTSSPTKATQKRGKVTLPFSGLCQSLLKSWVYYPSPPSPNTQSILQRECGMGDANQTVYNVGQNVKSTDLSYDLKTRNNGDSEDREGSFIVHELKSEFIKKRFSHRLSFMNVERGENKCVGAGQWCTHWNQHWISRESREGSFTR